MPKDESFSARHGGRSATTIGRACATLIAGVYKYSRAQISAADFADCLLGISNVLAGGDHTATFDKKAARLEEFKLIPP